MDKRACAADILGLGYRPGFTYYSRYWRKADVCLGYFKSGAVVMRDVETGVVRSHMTPKDSHPGSELVADIPNVFGWGVATTRAQREKVTA